MAKKTAEKITHPSSLDVACLIHGNVYSWQYVDRLYSMLSRHLTIPFRMHVYTEFHRHVPAPYVKHTLIEWSLPPNKKSWWYKMQLFNSDFFRGPLLYFDLDTVIVNNIDWIWKSRTNNFWAVKDFKYLWKPHYNSMNSSVMWWDTARFDHVWRDFQSRDLLEIVKKYHGDQDYLNTVIPANQQQHFDLEIVKSWRWQCLDGGYNFRKRQFNSPGVGTVFGPETSILIFHGHPKPGDIQDPVILQHWV